MEWYESLFLQICAHVLSRARVADEVRVDGRLNLGIDPTQRIVDAYRKGAGLAFNTQSAIKQMSNGVEYVVLILVREHQFSKAVQNLKEKCHVVLSATMETDAQASVVSNYYVDVAVCRSWEVTQSDS